MEKNHSQNFKWKQNSICQRSAWLHVKKLLDPPFQRQHPHQEISICMYQRGGANHDSICQFRAALKLYLLWAQSSAYCFSKSTFFFVFLGLWERCLRFFGHCTIEIALHNLTPNTDLSKAKPSDVSAMPCCLHQWMWQRTLDLFLGCKACSRGFRNCWSTWRKSRNIILLMLCQPSVSNGELPIVGGQEPYTSQWSVGSMSLFNSPTPRFCFLKNSIEDFDFIWFYQVAWILGLMIQCSFLNLIEYSKFRNNLDVFLWWLECHQCHQVTQRISWPK